MVAALTPLLLLVFPYGLPHLMNLIPYCPLFRASQSTSPIWYTIKRASSYIIVMSSYLAFGKYTPQWKWLTNELPKVNKSETSWLIILMHRPMYSSYVHHYMEGETK